MYLTKIFLVIGSLWMTLGVSICHGQILDYSVVPKPKDNFLEASFRYLNPDPKATPEIILVYIPGTDGDARGVIQDFQFLATCKICHAALLGCYFRGEGLGYDVPDGGSGAALDDAIFHFAQQTGNPLLTSAPLLFWGHSQGAQFAFNYACWRPHRVKAFAAIKPGHFQLAPQAASFQVPGLLVAGEYDDPGRIRTVAQTFIDAAGKHSKWAILFEKDAGHDVAQSGDFAQKFFESVCQDGLAKTPVFFSPETENSEVLSSASSNLCWFPDQQVADAWRRLHKLAVLQSLVSLPDKPGLQELINTNLVPEKYECENGASRSGVLNLNATRDGVMIDHVSISGDGFSLDGPDAGTLPMRLKIRFAPQESAWGAVRGNIVIEGRLDGHKVDPMEIRIPGMVKGPVIPFPSLLYLGVALPGQTVDRTIVLRSNQTALQVTDIKVPNGITIVTESESGVKTGLQLHIRWIAGSRYGSMSDEIRLQFNSPEKGELRIPILGAVSKPAQ
jgi:pimeloyl-ACP methyl ester carboxylesterase